MRGAAWAAAVCLVACCAAGCCRRPAAEPLRGPDGSAAEPRGASAPEEGRAAQPVGHLVTSDPAVPAEVGESWGMQRDFFTQNGFEIMEWEDAKALLRQRSYRGGKQYHTGWLTIYTDDGRKVVTNQPEIDAFYRFMETEGLPTTGFGTE